jgi:hypothetical protein
MELIPKAFVVGVFAATEPGSPDLERANRIWSELSARYDYRRLSRTGEGVHFIGVGSDDALIIQPPLVQVRSTAKMGVQNAADEAEVAIRTVARHLGYAQFFNLGIKHVFQAPAPKGDAQEFVMRRLLGRDPVDLGDLERGGGVWGGVKYRLAAPDGSVYTLVIEPLIANNQYLFIDLDAQFPGPAETDRIPDRAREAEEYADGAIRRYLEAAE